MVVNFKITRYKGEKCSKNIRNARNAYLKGVFERARTIIRDFIIFKTIVLIVIRIMMHFF